MREKKGLAPPKAAFNFMKNSDKEICICTFLSFQSE